MNEKLEVDIYQFFSTEIGKMEQRLTSRINELSASVDRRFEESERRTEKRFEEFERRTEKRFEEFESRNNARFDKLEEEIRWPRRVAIGGVITTVIAAVAAFTGWAKLLFVKTP